VAAVLPIICSKHSLRRPVKLGPIFEIHRVVVIPVAALDETVRLEDADDLPANLVSINDMAAGAGLRPELFPGRPVAVSAGFCVNRRGEQGRCDISYHWQPA
jgi:hypothetical protein